MHNTSSKSFSNFTIKQIVIQIIINREYSIHILVIRTTMQMPLLDIKFPAVLNILHHNFLLMETFSSLILIVTLVLNNNNSNKILIFTTVAIITSNLKTFDTLTINTFYYELIIIIT